MTPSLRVLIMDETYRSPESDGGSRALHDLHRSLLELGHQARLCQSDELLRRGGWDIAFMSRPLQAMRWNQLAKQGARRTIFLGHDLHHRRMAAELAAEQRSTAPAQVMAAVERACWRSHDLSLYPSAEECAVVAATRARARWFPYFRIDRVTPARAYVPSEQRPLLLFVGGAAHAPNRLGLAWFATDVLPQIAGMAPRTMVVGNWPSTERQGLEQHGVTFAGTLGDAELAALRQQATALIAPLTCGAGLKCKVIEALASGVPLITTSVGLQGIDWPQDLAFRADKPEAWAAALHAVTSDPGRVQRHAAAAADYVMKHHGSKAYLLALQELLNDVQKADALTPPPGTGMVGHRS